MRIASFYDQVRDPKTAVFQLLGFAFRSLPGSEAHALMCSMLRWSYIGHHVEARTDSTNTMAPLTTEYPQLRSPLSNLSTELNAPSDSHDEDNLPRYTSALFERGQEDGRVLQRTYSTLTLDPPRFKVSIKFGGGMDREPDVIRRLLAIWLPRTFVIDWESRFEGNEEILCMKAPS